MFPFRLAASWLLILLLAAGTRAQTATPVTPAIQSGAANTPVAPAQSSTPKSAIERQRAAIQKQINAAQRTRAKDAAAPTFLDRQAKSILKQRGDTPPPPLTASPQEEFFLSTPPEAMQPAAEPAVAPVAFLPPCNPENPLQVSHLIDEASRQQGLAPALVHAVVQQESAFNPCAVSPAGAMGLMQLMPSTADHFGVSNPFNAEDNLRAGTSFLKALLDRYNGNLGLALSAYNAGPGAVDRFGSVPPYAETEDYVTRILKKLGVDRPNANTQANPSGMTLPVDPLMPFNAIPQIN